MKSQNPICEVDAIGTKHWYLNGQRHRIDGPAVDHSDGTKQWFLNGKQHRTDGPAAEYPNSTKFWCLNGKYHENPPKSYKNPLQLGDLLVVNNEVNFVGRKEGLACLLLPSNSWIFEWEKSYE